MQIPLVNVQRPEQTPVDLHVKEIPLAQGEAKIPMEIRNVAIVHVMMIQDGGEKKHLVPVVKAEIRPPRGKKETRTPLEGVEGSELMTRNVQRRIERGRKSAIKKHQLGLKTTFPLVLVVKE
jgi:hypothetical protein